MCKECETCVHKSDFKAVECGTCEVGYYDGVQQGLPSNYKPRPKTKADRIQEKLAETLSGMCKIAEQCDDCPMEGNCPGGSYDLHVWSKWLQQPAEGD